MKSSENLETAYNRLHALHVHAGQAETLAEVEKCLDGPWHTALRNALEDIRGLKVLEIASGMGALSYWLNRQGGEVWSADFASEAVEMTRNLVAPEFPEAAPRVLQADFQAMPFEDNTFDVLISCETLEHLPDYEKGLSEAFRVLKPGGRLYLTTENYLNLTGLYRLLEEKIRRRPWRSGAFVQPVEQFFTAPALLAGIRKHGFQVLSFDSRGYYFYLPRRPRPWDMVWLAAPGPHRALFRLMGRHLFVKAVKPE